MHRIECAQFSKELEEGLVEYGPELQAAMEPPQVEAHPIIHEPIVVEDLETGGTDTHHASAPVDAVDAVDATNAMESMPQSYQDAVLQSSKRKKSKGVKRVLSLHYRPKRGQDNGSALRPPCSASQMLRKLGWMTKLPEP